MWVVVAQSTTYTTVYIFGVLAGPVGKVDGIGLYPKKQKQNLFTDKLQNAQF